METRKLRRLLIAVLILLPVAAISLFFSLREREPEGLRGEDRVQWTIDHAESIRDEILEAIRTGRKLSPSQMIAASRLFVHTYTIHKGGRGPHAKIEPYAAWRMLQTLKKGQPKLRVTCGPRAYALKWILEGAGIRSRRVQIYSSTTDEIRGHRFLDVFNPETGRWEVQDPSHDITYRRVGTGEGACTEDMIFEDLGKFEPYSSGERHDWKTCGVEFLRKEYFHAMWYEEARPPLVLINPARFDVKKRFPIEKDATFEEWARHRYEKPRRPKAVFRLGHSQPGDLEPPPTHE